MLRDYINPGAGLEHFTRRGKGDSRIEALSDGIFALAVAMLLFSTSVPTNFDELWLFVSDLIPFGICSVFVFWIWRTQIVFFQRFGLTQDQKVIRLTFMLIMLVPFYVYALKFLMSWLVNLIGGMLKSAIFGLPLYETVGYLMQMVPMSDMPKVMCIYGLGYMGVFALFTLLYRYVIRHPELLGLNKLEFIETQHSYYQYLSMVFIGGISVGFGVLGLLIDWPWASFFSGISYNLTIPSSMWLVRWRKRKLAEAAENQS